MTAANTDAPIEADDLTPQPDGAFDSSNDPFAPLENDTPDTPDAEESEDSTEETKTDEQSKADGTPDKALQKLQQRQSAIEDTLQNKLDELTQRIENTGASKPQEQEAQAEAEQAIADFSDLLDSEGDGDDFVERSQLNKVLQRVQDSFGKLQQPTAANDLKKQLDERDKRIKQLEDRFGQVDDVLAETQAQRVLRQRSDQEGIDVAPLWEEAKKFALTEYEGEPTEVLNAVARKQWNKLIADKKSAGEPKPKSKQKAGTKPPSQSAGTDPVDPTATQAKRSATRSKPPMWSPD